MERRKEAVGKNVSFFNSYLSYLVRRMKRKKEKNHRKKSHDEITQSGDGYLVTLI